MFDKSKDIARFTELYTNPNVTIDDICRIFDYATGSIYRMGWELGLKRPREVRGLQLGLKQLRAYCERVSAELPPVPRQYGLKQFVARPNTLDFILFFSDAHAGRYTISTNAVVFGNRMTALYNRITQKVNLFREHWPIGKLDIFSLGDLVTGERVGLNVTLEELEHTVLTQCYNIAIPRLTSFTLALLNDFTAIDVFAVPGNHGVVTRPQVSKGANWDTIVALGWQAKMAAHEEVTFDIATANWYNTATVKGLDWLLIHGDQFKGGCNYSNILNGVRQWHQSIKEHFDYMAMGHFHHWCKFCEVFMNGSLLTDDEWSREVVKRDAECVQLLIAVSDKGIEDVMPIWLDDVGEE